MSTPQKTALIYSPVCLNHTVPFGHFESPARITSIINKLSHLPEWELLQHQAPALADRSILELVHTKTHINSIINAPIGCLDGGDTYKSQGTWDAVLHSVGSVVKAVDLCETGQASRAFCLIRPPGHHATADKSMGFCILNNVAIGARYAQSKGFSKILIIDFDVHHGNGTQEIFYSDPTVLYFSTHQYPDFPGTGGKDEIGIGEGIGCTVNIPMPIGVGDEEFVEVLIGME